MSVVNHSDNEARREPEWSRGHNLGAGSRPIRTHNTGRKCFALRKCSHSFRSISVCFEKVFTLV